MAKKEQKKPEQKEEMQLPPGMSEEAKKKLKDIKGKIEGFKDDIIKKFDDYILGVGLLPPPKPEELPKGQEQKPEEKDRIHVLVLVDDTDSKKMSKAELKDKLTSICDDFAQKRDKKIFPEIFLLSELWQSCYDNKYDLLRLIAMAAPIFDKGMLAAVKIGEVHKSMVLKKFERYIVSYVLFGSLTRGEATEESDIDVAIIIDDTDVKKMTRLELKDKLRAIIIGMGMEAGSITGIKNKLNIQVYILTEFWDAIKEANPVMFTVLRDGVPFYDRGMFMPWKQLLKMGKIKPSHEAIEMFMSTGEQMVGRVKNKIKDLIEHEIYWATLTPTQAALMLYGIPPPTPKETINLLEEVFVKKEKLLEKKYVDTMKSIRKYYKEIEHGTLKEVKGKEVDDLLQKADDYLKRIKKLFGEIEGIKEKKDMVHTYDNISTIVRDVLSLEGIKKVADKDLVAVFDDELVSTGKVPAKFLTILKDIVKAKKHYDQGKLTKTDIDKVRKSSRDFIKFLVEYMQRNRAAEIERAKIRIKHGKKYGEVILMEKEAFIIEDVDAEEKQMQKAQVKEDGSLGTFKNTTLEEFEKSLAKAVFPKRVYIKEALFEDLKRLFGPEVEVMVTR